MKKNIIIVLVVILIFGLISSIALPISNNLLEKYEANYEQFTEVVIADKIVYYQQREIGEAIVEKDFIVYQFDKDTGELLAKKTHWRDDLPEQLPKIKISKRKAEAIVEGETQFSKLYFISPESDVFPIDPTPENPCWVVRSIDNGNMIVTIIDAITGEKLGYGIPPPYTAFSLSGPCYFYPCSGAWNDWYKNAETWFNTMGYSTESVEWPTETRVRNHIQSIETAMFYEIAHGDSTCFVSGCLDGSDYEFTYASEIETWITNYQKMRFTFLGSCEGMCNTGDDTLSYEFRKGSSKNTATVGYCHMDSAACGTCWTQSIQWQNTLFDYMNQGWTVKDAFDQANTDYPACAIPSCMRFAGDENFKAVPVVNREAMCEETITKDTVLSYDLLNCFGNGLIIGADDITLDCNGFSITGNNNGYGIYTNANHGTVKNCRVENFDYGIYVDGSNNLIYNNYLNNTINAYDSLGETIDDFEDGNYDLNPTWTLNCGGFPTGEMVSGYNSNYAFQINSTGGDGLACAMLPFNATEGQEIVYACKGWGCGIGVWNGTQMIHTSTPRTAKAGYYPDWEIFSVNVTQTQNGVSLNIYNRADLPSTIGQHAIFDNIVTKGVNFRQDLVGYWKLDEDPISELWSFDVDAAGWTPIDGTWTVHDGIYEVNSSDWGTSSAGESYWENYTVEIRAKPLSALWAFDVSLTVRATQATSTNYGFRIIPGFSDWPTIVLEKYIDGVRTALGELTESISPDVWYNMTLKVNGNNITAWLDGTQKFSVIDNDISAGKIHIAAKGNASFDYVKVTSEDVAKDSSGNDNHGIIYGANSVDGKDEKALDFDGLDDYVEMNDNGNFSGLSAVTVMGWVNTTSTEDAGQRTLFSSAGYQTFIRHHPYHQIESWIYTDAGNFVTYSSIPTKLNDGVWHHMALTYDRNTNTMIHYVDGVYAGSRSDLSGTMLMGAVAKIGSGLDYFNGTIDEVKIYSRALTEGEIKIELGKGRNYWNTTKKLAFNKEGLASYWRFDEGTGDIVRDDSINGNDGTILPQIIDDFNDGNPDGWVMNCDGADWSTVSGYEGAYVIRIWPTVGPLGCAYSGPFSVVEGQTIAFACRGSGDTVCRLSVWSDTHGFISSGDGHNWHVGDGNWHVYETKIDYKESNAYIYFYSNEIGSWSEYDFITLGPMWVDGKYGKALSFDGMDDYVKISNPPPMSTLTVSFWLYPKAFSQSARVIDRWQQNENADWLIYLDTSGNLKLYSYNCFGGGTSTTPLQLNKWQHVVGVWDQNAAYIYVDSVQKVAHTYSFCLQSSNTPWIEIGGAPDDLPLNHFTGIIDEVKIYSRALTEGEIKEEYEKGTSGENIVGGLYLGGNYWHDYIGLDNGEGTCPGIPNVSGDGIGDTGKIPYDSKDLILTEGDYLPLVLDSDKDGIHDYLDNCWYRSNPNQEDSDGNCPSPPYLSDPKCGDACAGGCPHIYTWNGNEYILDNNLLPFSEGIQGDVEDYYKLEKPLVQENGKYSLMIGEFEQEHSYFDEVQLLAIDHDSSFKIAPSPFGEILTYKNPIPTFAYDNEFNDLTFVLNQIDGNAFEGHKDDFIVLNFGKVDSGNAKLVMRSDWHGPPRMIKWSVHVHVLKDGEWEEVAIVIPRNYWADDAVDLSDYLTDEDLVVRLYFTSTHKMDSVGLDTSEPEEFEVKYGNLVSATHSKDGNVKQKLVKSDETYAELIPRQDIKLEFTLPNNKEYVRDYIFYSKGHYYKIE